MKNLFVSMKKRHLWLLTDLVLLAAFWLCRGNRAWMNTLADRVTTPFKLALGRLCYQVDFSVMEVLCILLTLGTLYYLGATVLTLLRAKGQRLRCLYGGVLGALCCGLTIYVGFCFLWGVNYYTDSFQDRSGIYAQPVTVDRLEQVTAYFAQQVNEAADGVPRDEHGLFALPREEILEGSKTVYDAVERRFPFLELDDPGVKGVYFSRVMSILDFTGVYCPFTGESNVNMDSPACMLPATVAHELAHQRGIASEQECNFLAILAATTSGDPAYAYSGWLMGYLYLGNALYRADQDRWRAIRETLVEPVQADLRYHSAYWKQFSETVPQKVSNTVYDGFLKSYGDEHGIQSYGTVVDMLVAYYGKP